MLRLPPPLWALLLITAFYFLSDAPIFAGLPSWRNQIAGDAAMILGFAISFIAFAQFARAGTQIAPTSKTNDKLVVSGIYHFTRNPMYLGLLIFSIGAALWFGRPLTFLAPLTLFSIANWAFIPFEEAKMRAQFGAEFDAYTKRVRRWM